MRRIDERMFVAGQVRPGEVAALTEQGIAMIVNNRPDGEEPGQPAAAEIEAAAKAAGLGYRFIPVAGGLAPDQVAAMAEALAEAGGPMLAFCRSGTRSAFLWAMAEAQRGADVEALIAKGAAAGYDLSPIRAWIRG